MNSQRALAPGHYRCLWCQSPKAFKAKGNAPVPKFCDSYCRNLYHTAARKLGQTILEQSIMDLGDLKRFMEGGGRLTVSEYRGVPKLTVHAIFDGTESGD